MSISNNESNRNNASKISKNSRISTGAVVARIVKYWGKVSETQFLMFIACMAIFTVYNSVIIGNSLTEYGGFKMLLMFGCFCLIDMFSYGISSANVYAMRAISFGSTRKEAIIGQQFGVILVIVQDYIIALIALALNHNLNRFYVIKVAFIGVGALLFISGLAQIGSVIVAKFDMKWLISIMVLIVIGILCGIFGAMSVFSNNQLAVFFSSKHGLDYAVGIIGVLMYLIGLVVDIGYVKNMEVKC